MELRRAVGARVIDRTHRGTGTHIKPMMLRERGSGRSGFRLRTLTRGFRLSALARGLALVLLAAPVMGCSLFHKDEDYVPDTPADKLYNEGLFLLNDKQDYKEAAKKFDEVDRENPYSDWARKALLMSGLRQLSGRAVRRLHQCGQALRDAASLRARMRPTRNI